MVVGVCSSTPSVRNRPGQPSAGYDPNRCDHCGRKLPCHPCALRAAQERNDRYLDEINDEPEPGPPLLVWFACRFAPEHVNRLRAEWPYALEVVEPQEPGDLWGVWLARRSEDIGRKPPMEYEVTDTRIAALGKPWFEVYFETIAQNPTSEP